MREIFVITTTEMGMGQLQAAAERAGRAASLVDASLVFNDEDGYVDVTERPDIFEFYEDDERAQLAPAGPDPRLFRVYFDNPNLAVRVIVDLFPSVPSVVVDNDHGVLVSLPRFVSLLAAHPKWDWSASEELPGSLQQ